MPILPLLPLPDASFQFLLGKELIWPNYFSIFWSVFLHGCTNTPAAKEKLGTVTQQSRSPGHNRTKLHPLEARVSQNVCPTSLTPFCAFTCCVLFVPMYLFSQNLKFFLYKLSLNKWFSWGLIYVNEFCALLLVLITTLLLTPPVMLKVKIWSSTVNYFC